MGFDAGGPRRINFYTDIGMSKIQLSFRIYFIWSRVIETPCCELGTVLFPHCFLNKYIWWHLLLPSSHRRFSSSNRMATTGGTCYCLSHIPLCFVLVLKISPVVLGTIKINHARWFVTQNALWIKDVQKTRRHHKIAVVDRFANMYVKSPLELI